MSFWSMINVFLTKSYVKKLPRKIHFYTSRHVTQSLRPPPIAYQIDAFSNLGLIGLPTFGPAPKRVI